MAHARAIRKNKVERQLSFQPKKRADVIQFPSSPRYENELPSMNSDDLRLLNTMLYERYMSAKSQTDAMAEEMVRADNQYYGVFSDGIDDEERVFIPKTRENVKAIHSYLIHLMSQMDTLITAMPKISSIQAREEEYKRAKIMEAFLNFYFNDVWNFKNDIFPAYLKNFLKYPLPLFKLVYDPTTPAYKPDLQLSVGDRAMTYIDPHSGNNIKNARWVFERYFLPRTEVLRRIDEGFWYWPNSQWDLLESAGTIYPGQWASNILTVASQDISDLTLKRYLGQYYNEPQMLEDEFIEILDYWQPERSGQKDRYMVKLGGIEGEFVRIGSFPLAHKKSVPFRGKSYDPHETQVDGKSSVEEQKEHQKIKNTFYNLRVKDIRQNILSRVATLAPFIDETTISDLKTDQKFIRLNEEKLRAMMTNSNFKLSDLFAQMPISTSTSELLVADLPYLDKEFRETSNVSEIFKGQAGPHEQTLGEISAQNTNNQAQLRPVYLQVMRPITELGEMMVDYVQDESFFTEDRLIQIVGNNNYADTIEGWHSTKDNKIHVFRVTYDDMLVDVNLDIISNVDAQASRSFLMATIERIFFSIGQIPDLYNELKKEYSFGKILEVMMENTGRDLEAIRLTDKDREAMKEEQKQGMESQMQIQKQVELQTMSLKADFEQIKSQIKSQEILLKSQIKAEESNQSWNYENKQVEQLHQNDLERIKFEILEQLKASLAEMNKEFMLEKNRP